MSASIEFLTALGQAFSAIALYGVDHPTRVSAVARVIATLDRTIADGSALRLSFIDNEVIVGSKTLTDLRGWEWGQRLSGIGVQRLEVESNPGPRPADVEAMLLELRTRLSAPHCSVAPWNSGAIRFGPLAALTNESVVVHSVIEALEFSGLAEEIETLEYVHDQVIQGHVVPMAEVEAIVHSLALTVRREEDLVLPLLELRTFDEYLTTHACNMSMLSIGLSEALGIPDTETRAIGAAALLADLGKTKLPPTLLTKTGALSEAERRQFETHPAEGARLLSARGRGHSLAATVAYEHHLFFNGKGGYPRLDFPRDTHFASRIVHVCDVYDALCSKRPWRDAWSQHRALTHLESVAGTELDPSIVAAFVPMVRGAADLRHMIESPAVR